MSTKQRPPAADPPWLDSARRQLDADAALADAATRSRLSRARRAALAQLPPQAPWHSALNRWWGGAVATAGCLLVALLWLGDGGRSPLPEPPAETLSADSDLLTDQAAPAFFDELDFYNWLAREGIDDHEISDEHDV